MREHRKTKNGKHTVQLVMDPELHRRLSELAESDDRSLPRYVIRFLKTHLPPNRVVGMATETTGGTDAQIESDSKFLRSDPREAIRRRVDLEREKRRGNPPAEL